MQVDGSKVRARREDLGLTGAVLSSAAGVGASYLSKIERGLACDPSPQVMARLAKALGCAIVDLRPAAVEG